MNRQTRNPQSASLSSKGLVCAMKDGLGDNISTSTINYALQKPTDKISLKPGTILTNRYSIKRLLGSGSFGRVVDAYDLENKKNIAIKFINMSDGYYKQSHKEIEFLQLIKREKGNDFIVELHNYFYFNNHICSVFELLSETLHEYMMTEYPAGFSLNRTRDYAKQLCCALKHLSELHIMHGDLKLDNIMLKHPEANTLKLVDFGSACRPGEKVDPNIRALHYRSPELILHYKVGISTDMWSLGCILAELFTADVLFGGKDKIAQINKFVELLGMPPIGLLDRSARSGKFFERTTGVERYVLKKPRDGEIYKPPGTRKIHDVLGIDMEGSLFEKKEDDDNYLYEYFDFIDLIRNMLEYNPRKRITPHQALNHNFFRS